MDGRGRRRKGHNFERRVANDLKKYFPESRRGYQSRNNQDMVPDVEIPKFFIECKAHKRTNIKAALEQARDGKKSEDDRIPLAICKDDNQPIIVAMYYDDFLELLEDLP